MLLATLALNVFHNFVLAACLEIDMPFFNPLPRRFNPLYHTRLPTTLSRIPFAGFEKIRLYEILLQHDFPGAGRDDGPAAGLDNTPRGASAPQSLFYRH